MLSLSGIWALSPMSALNLFQAHISPVAFSLDQLPERNTA